MQRALKMFGIAKIGQDFHPKSSMKKESIWFVNHHELEMIHGR
jgi:hypothetical protein